MSSEMDNLRESATETIYLVPDREEGQLYYSWCDDPAPSFGMDASEAVAYVRKDVHEARIAELEEREQAMAKRLIEIEQNGECIECEEAVSEQLKQAEWAIAEGGASLKSAIEREQALAAYIERLRHWVKCSNQYATILQEAPEISLARRDLIKQAEALEEEAECLSDIEYAQDRLLESAAEKRQRAQSLK